MSQTIVCTEASIEELKLAIKNRQPIAGIKAAITHVGAHLDELFALYLMLKTPEGNHLFPGLEGVAFRTKNELNEVQGEEGFYKALSIGYLLFGTGKGPFDEHGNRDKGITCAQLVADYLGLTKTKLGKIVYSEFLNYVNHEDRHGNDLAKNCTSIQYANIVRPGFFSEDIKTAWQLVYAGHKEPDAVIAEAFAYMENKIQFQRHLFHPALLEFERVEKKCISLTFLEGRKSKTPILLIVQSDNDQIVKAAKFSFSSNQQYDVKVLLKLNSKGQFYICPMNGVSLIDVVKAIRARIAKKRNLYFLNWQQLETDGETPGIEEVHYHKDSDSIMNGSLTQPDVSGLIGSVLSTQELIDAIIEGLSTTFPYEGCKSECVKRKCPLYFSGFLKCHEARKKVV